MHGMFRDRSYYVNLSSWYSLVKTLVTVARATKTHAVYAGRCEQLMYHSVEHCTRLGRLICSHGNLPTPRGF